MKEAFHLTAPYTISQANDGMNTFHGQGQRPNICLRARKRRRATCSAYHLAPTLTSADKAKDALHRSWSAAFGTLVGPSS